MRDIDRLALEMYTKPIKGLNKHIESLENDLHYHDPIFGEDYGQLERSTWIGELKRERQGWIEDMQYNIGSRR